MRIAGAVPPFMVLQHSPGYRPRELDLLQYVVADLGVGLNHLILDLVEFAGLAKDLSGYSDLADIVQQPRDADSFDLSGWDFHDLGYGAGQIGHSHLVAGGVGVAGFDGGGDGLYRGLHGPFQSLETALQLLLYLFPFGDVAIDAAVTEETAIAADDGDGAGLHDHRVPVFVRAGVLQK